MQWVGHSFWCAVDDLKYRRIGKMLQATLGRLWCGLLGHGMKRIMIGKKPPYYKCPRCGKTWEKC